MTCRSPRRTDASFLPSPTAPTGRLNTLLRGSDFSKISSVRTSSRTKVLSVPTKRGSEFEGRRWGEWGGLGGTGGGGELEPLDSARELEDKEVEDGRFFDLKNPSIIPLSLSRRSLPS